MSDSLTTLSKAGHTLTRRLPPQIHRAISAAASLPEPLLLAAALVSAAVMSTAGAVFLQRRFPGLVPRLRRWYFLRKLLRGDGGDAVFLSLYLGAVVVMALVLLVLACFVQTSPVLALVGLFVSVPGVFLSIFLDGALSFADPEEFQTEASTLPGGLRRRLGLHAAVGAIVASLVLVLPGLCPLPALDPNS